jgi:hypothetical protein
MLWNVTQVYVERSNGVDTLHKVSIQGSEVIFETLRNDLPALLSDVELCHHRKLEVPSSPYASLLAKSSA